MEKDKLLIALLFFLLQIACNHPNKVVESKCFEEPKIFVKKSKAPIFFISGQIDASCFYGIGSGYYVDSIRRVVVFDGVRVYVNFASEDDRFDLLFSFDDNIGIQRKIRVKHRNWLEGKPEEFIVKSYSVELMNKFTKSDGSEKCVLLKVHRLISAFRDQGVGVLDGALFFSDREGFVGSYYSPPENPKMIVQKCGDIFDGLIDYTDYRFYEIK